LHGVLCGDETVRKIERESHAHLLFRSALNKSASSIEVLESDSSSTLQSASSMGALVSQRIATAATVGLMSFVVIQGYDSLAVGLAMSAIEDIIECAQINCGDNDVMQCPGNATSIADPVSGSPSCISYRALRRKNKKRKRSAAILEMQLNKLNNLGIEDKVGGEVSGREGFDAMTTNDDDALKRTILSVLRDVTLAEEQDLISTADEREDRITGVDGGEGLVDEEKLEDGEIRDEVDGHEECVASSPSSIRTAFACTSFKDDSSLSQSVRRKSGGGAVSDAKNVSIPRRSLKVGPHSGLMNDSVVSRMDGEFVVWGACDDDNESFATGSSCLGERSIRSSAADHRFTDVRENPFEKAISRASCAATGSNVVVKSTPQVERAPTTRRRQPNHVLSPIHEIDVNQIAVHEIPLPRNDVHECQPLTDTNASEKICGLQAKVCPTKWYQTKLSPTKLSPTKSSPSKLKLFQTPKCGMKLDVSLVDLTGDTPDIKIQPLMEVSVKTTKPCSQSTIARTKLPKLDANDNISVFDLTSNGPAVVNSLSVIPKAKKVVRSTASASAGSSGQAVVSPAKLRYIILDGSNIAMA